MKKLLVFGLMLSLFTFSGSKEEVKTTYAAEPGTSATFYSGSIKEIILASDAKDVVDEIVNIKVSNEATDLPAEADYKVLVGDGITAYIFKTDSTVTDPLRYICILYANVKTIYANEDSSNMFANFGTVVETIDVSKLNTENVSNMSSMFKYCNSVNNLDVSGFNTSNVTDMNSMFLGCNSLTTLDVSNFDTSKVNNMKDMFSSCRRLTTLEVSKFNTSKVENMSSMFSGCNSLTTLDLSSFNTSNVTNMKCMFNRCRSLTSLNLSNFNTLKVENMIGMFECCEKLETVNLSSFKTPNVTDISAMFYECKSLTSLNLSNFNTSKVKSLRNMFAFCNSLITLDLSSFITSEVTETQLMFADCTSLTKLDLSSFDMSNTTYTLNMLAGCNALEYLDAPKKLNEEAPIDLPAQFETHCGVSQLTADNLAKYNVIDTVCSEFIDEWKTLRDSNNSICNALIPGSAANDTLTKLLEQYKTFDDDRKKLLDETIDYESASIGDSIKYLQEVMNGNQTTETNYGYAKEDSGSFITSSINEESSYLVAVISLIGILSITGYYFYNKKKTQCND